MEDKFKWDEYYYDNRNVRILQTNIIKIGQESHETATIGISNKRTLDKHKQVETRILGFPISMKDVITDQVEFVEQNHDIDSNFWLGKKEKYSGTSDLVVVGIIDYNLRIDTRTYKSYRHILSELGGLGSFIAPIFSLLTPIFVVFFLMKLMSILQMEYTQQYLSQLKDTVIETYYELKSDEQFLDYLHNHKSSISPNC